MIDIIIIGSGGAALSAALKAKENNAEVLVISKTYPTHSQTVQAQGGINAVLNEEIDSVKFHIEDTYKSSKKLANKKNIEYMCNMAKDTIFWLDEIGVPFSKSETSQIEQRPFGGTKYSRTCYSSDYTGLKIMHTLYDTCIKNEIKFLNEYILIDLVVENNCVKACYILNLLNSKIEKIYTKSVILATGGYSNIYQPYTTNSNSTTGDGIAIAYNNGAKLSNMEFVQFHPTALKGSNTLISESARAEGAYLVCKDGTRFVNELSTRDEVARAIKHKMIEGEDVYLDLRHLDINVVKEKMPQEIKLIKELLNLNVEKDLIPINPAAHYTMGGILTNVSCETSIENLYACGECAQTNIHGANRLGGNSLLEIISFGRVCGENASKKALKIDEKVASDFDKNIYENYIHTIISKKSDTTIYKIKEKLAEIMFTKVGLFRNKDSLIELKEELEILSNDFNKVGISDKSEIYNKNLQEYFELKNILTISQLVVISAIQREESRGSHYRTDYQKESSKFEKISIIYKKENKLIHQFEEIL